MSMNIGCVLSVDVFSSEKSPFDWLVLTSLPALQLTKLHQLAMQHIPFTSLGQSNPTFPGTYPKIPGEVFLSLCHSVHFSTSLSGWFFCIFFFPFCFPNLFFTIFSLSRSLSACVINHYLSC